MLSEKIASVLATPYQDGALRQALAVLERYGEVDGTEDADELRNCVEQRYLKQVASVLADLEPAYTAAAAVGRRVRTLAELHRQMRSSVDAAATAVAPALAQARTLEAEQRQLCARAEAVNEILSSFYLSEADQRVLTDPGVPVDEAFRQALDRARAVEAAVPRLLAMSAVQGEHAAQQVRKAVSAGLNRVRAHLSWRIRELFAADVRPGPEEREWLRVLHDRPALLRSLLNEFADVRRRDLSAGFARAISSGTFGRDLGADPPRYVGDVLAWVHAAIVNEYEAFGMLLDPDASMGQNGPLETGAFGNQGAREVLQETVDGVLKGLDSQLRPRLIQLVLLLDNPVVIDDVGHIVAFYQSLLTKYGVSSVDAALKGVEDALEQQFQRCVMLETEKAQRFSAPADLSAPAFLERALGMLTRVLKAYENSVLYSPRGDKTLHSRIDAMLDPFLAHCRDAASASLPDFERQVFVLNCLDAARAALAPFLFAVYKADAVETEVENAVKALAETVAAKLYTESGLAEWSKIDRAEFESKFDAFLAAAALGLGNQFRLVCSPRLASEARTTACELFIKQYAETTGSERPDLRLLLL